MSQITLRIPDELHTKLRIIAAYKDQSLNTVAIECLVQAVEKWESENMAIPLIPKESADNSPE